MIPSTIEEEIKHVPQVFEINNNEDLSRINLVLKNCKLLKKKVEDELVPKKQDAYKSYKGICDMISKYVEPIDVVIDKINVAIKQWTVKKDAEAKALQDKINKQLAEDAEKVRQAQLKQAETMTNDWDKEVAIEKAVAIQAQTVDLKACQETVAPKEQGQYKRYNWRARVVNPDLVPKHFWIIDQSALDKKAKELKDTDTIAGCEIYNDFVIVTKI